MDEPVVAVESEPAGIVGALAADESGAFETAAERLDALAVWRLLCRGARPRRPLRLRWRRPGPPLAPLPPGFLERACCVLEQLTEAALGAPPGTIEADVLRWAPADLVAVAAVGGWHFAGAEPPPAPAPIANSLWSEGV